MTGLVQQYNSLSLARRCYGLDTYILELLEGFSTKRYNLIPQPGRIKMECLGIAIVPFIVNRIALYGQDIAGHADKSNTYIASTYINNHKGFAGGLDCT